MSSKDNKINTPEDLQKLVKAVVHYVTHDLEIHNDTEILQVVTTTLASCLVMLANSVSKVVGKDFEELKLELLEVAAKELKHQVTTIKVINADDGDNKPLLLN